MTCAETYSWVLEIVHQSRMCHIDWSGQFHEHIFIFFLILRLQHKIKLKNLCIWAS